MVSVVIEITEKNNINKRYYQTIEYQNNVNIIVFQDFRINLSPYKFVLLVIN